MIFSISVLLCLTATGAFAQSKDERVYNRLLREAKGVMRTERCGVSRINSRSAYEDFFNQPSEFGERRDPILFETGDRVIGGRQVNSRDEFPFFCRLEIKRSENATGSALCGGTLISYQHIMTAAHCIADGRTFVTAICGTTRRTGGIRIKVGELVQHPFYNGIGYDMALLKLEKPLPRGRSFIKPACVASKEQPVGTKTVVVGFGSTDVRGVGSSQRMRAVELEILERKSCLAFFGFDDHTMLCASNPGVDACNGDSGGPLVYQNRFNQWVLTGIVSFGLNNEKGACANGIPGFYAEAHIGHSAVKTQFDAGKCRKLHEICTFDRPCCSPQKPGDKKMVCKGAFGAVLTCREKDD